MALRVLELLITGKSRTENPHSRRLHSRCNARACCLREVRVRAPHSDGSRAPRRYFRMHANHDIRTVLAGENDFIGFGDDLDGVQPHTGHSLPNVLGRAG